MSAPHTPPAITPSLLLRAYANGIFPMAEGAQSDEIYWVDPKLRGIFPRGGFHVSRSLARSLRKGGFDVSVNGDFDGTVAACADRPETWINDEIAELYGTLHRLGYAHSVEVRQNGVLTGGIYGVALGGAFFGESMFSRAPNTSKIALTYLIARLNAGGFTLFDTQFVTSHLKSLGAVEIPRKRYQEMLEGAIAAQADFFALPPGAPVDQILHLSTQTS